MMRAMAYADERLQGVVLQSVDDQRVVHAALVSAFFVGYSAGVVDSGTIVGRG